MFLHISVVHSFLLLSNSPMIINFLIHLSVDGHSCCFQFLMIMNKAVIKILIQHFFCSYMFAFLLSKCLEI